VTAVTTSGPMDEPTAPTPGGAPATGAAVPTPDHGGPTAGAGTTSAPTAAPGDRVDDAWADGDEAPEREVLTWEKFGIATRELAETVAADGYRPDVVIAVARGGLTVGGALAYALGVKNCGAMNVEFYTGIDERLDVPVVLPPSLDLVDVAGLRILVADDVADTGHTLRLVREVLAQHVAEARTAVLYRKPRSVVVPDYSWNETDRWVVFPWSAQPPVRGLPPV
jgi:hypoxanthine phosphoribosyltransferase